MFQVHQAFIEGKPWTVGNNKQLLLLSDNVHYVILHLGAALPSFQLGLFIRLDIRSAN